MKRLFFILAVCICLSSCQPPAEQPQPPEVPAPMAQGVWVTVFSKEKVLYSKGAADQLVHFCARTGITDIYLQIFRGGEAYYDSRIAESRTYGKMTEDMGEDPVDYLLKTAHASGIKVHAWINVLSLAQNKAAPILRMHGRSILTRDKSLRTSIKTEDVNESDKFFVRDDQLFLEPGDERVKAFLLNVVTEISERYPAFDGLHLDYIRYPYPVPFIPDSRFSDNGISYGFGERNIERFKEANGGINPLKDDMYANDLHLKWDAWKRKQVTDLVISIRSAVRAKNVHWVLSCAAVPAFERAYAVAFQDWTYWLSKDLVDEVVLMNYTRDRRLFYELSKAALNRKGWKKIKIGVGVFLFKSNEEFHRSVEIARALKPGGIVYFAYDDLPEVYSNDRPKSGMSNGL